MEDGKYSASQNESREAMCEVKVELPMDMLARLAQQAAASGVTLEQLVAQTVRELVE
ncbi:MAG: hypothetical protein IKV13_03385 [Akkermansia sp.]|nr:hypothetical protein [Akkermansia sp.]